MIHVVVDLEMNRIDRKYKEERKICMLETIEIGAVALDEHYQETDCFKIYVKPQYNSAIEKKIMELTGITIETLRDAPEFGTAFKQFSKWCAGFQDELSMYEWSNSDYYQLRHEMKLKNYQMSEFELSMMDNWHDFQREYGKLLGLSRSISLENALVYAGLDFQGKQHDALFDARNTGLLLEICEDEEKCQKALKSVMEALKPSRCSVTLGEMVDLSSIKFDQ